MAFLGKKKAGSPEGLDTAATVANVQPVLSKLKINPHPLEINLLTYKQKTRESNLLPVLLLVLFLLCGVAMGYYYKLGNDQLSGLMTQKTQLQAERDRLQKESGYSANFQSLQNQLSSKQANVNAVEAQKVHFSKVINEVSSVIPNGVYLTGVKLSKGSLGLSGFAGEYSQVASFIAGLREKPMFKNVTLASTGKGANNTQVQFAIEVGWEAVKQ